MARRKRKEDEVIWQPPEFDEVGYMRQEIQNAKIATVVIAWAVVGAILAYLLALWIPLVGYLAGLAAFGALYIVLPTLGLPIHGFKRRDWISHASVYFFSWLAFSILLLNAPFGDHTSPVVGQFQAGTVNLGSGVLAPPDNSTNCVSVADASSVHLSALGNNSLYVLFRATDNVQVASVHATVNGANVTFTDVSALPSACKSNPPQHNLASTYAIVYPISGVSSFEVAVTAVDTSGLSTTTSVTLLIS